MSWIRTATALIGFGFTIFQFFQRFSEMPGVAPPKHPGLSRTFGLLLIGMGIVGLFAAIFEYRGIVRYLWSDEFRDIAGMGEKPTITPTFILAILLLGFGLYAFSAVLTRTSVL